MELDLKRFTYVIDDIDSDPEWSGIEFESLQEESYLLEAAVDHDWIYHDGCDRSFPLTVQIYRRLDERLEKVVEGIVDMEMNPVFSGSVRKVKK